MELALVVLLIVVLAAVGMVVEHRARAARTALGVRIDALSDALSGRLEGEAVGRMSLAEELGQVRREVDALLVKVALHDGDFSVAPPPTQTLHAHIWEGAPSSEDATTKTYHCLYPHCSRVHTQRR